MNENEYDSADEVDEVESSEEEVAQKKKRRVKKWKVCLMCGFFRSHVEGFSIIRGVF
jgi:rubrerythrin